MIKLRDCGDPGHADHGWLDTRHCSSFADDYDPQQMEKWVQPNRAAPQPPATQPQPEDKPQKWTLLA